MLLLLLLALIYFTIATIWLLRQGNRTKALVTVLLVTLLIGILFFATNMELKDGELRWNPP